MRLCAVVAFLFLVCPTICCQDLAKPLTPVSVCRNFRASIVQVDTDTMHGSGFIVSPDGWIITALHVVADQKTLVKYGNLSVSILGTKTAIPAEVVSQVDKLAVLRDFAILKIGKSKLPALELGSEINVEDGSPITIIGFPLSASFRVPTGPIPRFCLAGTVAAQTAFPLGNLEFLHTIFFQGVSIKGISGAPIISLVTGKVIGIVSTRLTGIGPDLQQFNDELHLGHKGGVSMGGLTVEDIGRIIDILDLQLANGLGSGTGASDAANALQKAQADYKRHHPTK